LPGDKEGHTGQHVRLQREKQKSGKVKPKSERRVVDGQKVIDWMNSTKINANKRFTQNKPITFWPTATRSAIEK